MSGTTAESFAQSLDRSRWSEAALEAALSAYFGPVGYQGYRKLPDRRSALQKAGWDILICLEARTLSADVKVDHHKSDALCLELHSNMERNVAGWATSPGFTADYIVYLMPKCSEAFLLPYEHLKSALRSNVSVWINKASSNSDGFRLIRTTTPVGSESYTSLSLLVPKAEVIDAVGRCCVHSLNFP